CIRGRILLWNAVEVEYVVPKLDSIARQTDDSFHQPGPIDRRIEYDDVAANGIGPGGKMQCGERDLQVVGELVYENQFTLEDRRFHRTGGHPVPVRDGRLKRGCDEEDQRERTKPVAPDFLGNVLHK